MPLLASRLAGKAVLLLLVLAAGLVARWPWLPAEGYASDVLMYAQWGAYVADHGIAQAYATQDLTHGPVWLTLVGGAGWWWARVAAVVGQPPRPVPVPLVKLVPVAADMLLAWLLYDRARGRWARRGAAGLAALYVLNPGVILDSAWWGQTDSLAALWVVTATVCLAEGRPVPGCMAVALALLTKLQTYFIAPLAAVALLRSARPAALAQGVLAGGSVMLGLFWPLVAAGSVLDVPAMYLRLVDRHPTVHVTAFNVWWLGRGWSGNRLPDATLLLGPWSYKQVGLTLLAGYTTFVLWTLWRRFDAADVPLAAAALGMAFFMLPTQIHSRYLFPVFPLLLLASIQRPRLLGAYAVLSLTFLLNQAHLILPALGPLPAWLGGGERWGLTTSLPAGLNVAVFAALTWSLLRRRPQAKSSPRSLSTLPALQWR